MGQGGVGGEAEKSAWRLPIKVTKAWAGRGGQELSQLLRLADSVKDP